MCVSCYISFTYYWFRVLCNSSTQGYRFNYDVGHSIFSVPCHGLYLLDGSIYHMHPCPKKSCVQFTANLSLPLRGGCSHPPCRASLHPPEQQALSCFCIFALAVSSAFNAFSNKEMLNHPSNSSLNPASLLPQNLNQSTLMHTTKLPTYLSYLLLGWRRLWSGARCDSSL